MSSWDDKERRAVSETLSRAVSWFGDKPDRLGKPMVLHSVRVGLMGRNHEEMIAGFLHDVLEDLPELGSRIVESHILIQRGRGWLSKEDGERILAAVYAVTKGTREPYESFIQRVAISGPLAIAVKLNDLRDNLNRASELMEPAERDRLIGRWALAVMVLESKLNEKEDAA
jgi:hypothetical protein